MKSRWFGFLALAVLPCGAFGGVSRASYVPEPQPLKSAIEVHAFYYPGTEQMAEWDQVEQTLPHIKPLRTSWDFDDGVQGWYRNPYGTAYVRNPDGSIPFVRPTKEGVRPAQTQNLNPILPD